MEESEHAAKMRRIQDELLKLGKEFARFNEHVRRMAARLKQAQEEVAEVQIMSEKIAKRFTAMKAINMIK